MITKKNNPKDNTVRVTFQLPADAAEQSIAIVGDFNNWDETQDRMKRTRKGGPWRKTLTLKPGREVQFRYLIDGTQWHNEEEADRFVPNGYGSKNAVLIL